LIESSSKRHTSIVAVSLPTKLKELLNQYLTSLLIFSNPAQFSFLKSFVCSFFFSFIWLFFNQFQTKNKAGGR